MSLPSIGSRLAREGDQYLRSTRARRWRPPPAVAPPPAAAARRWAACPLGRRAPAGPVASGGAPRCPSRFARSCRRTPVKFEPKFHIQGIKTNMQTLKSVRVYKQSRRSQPLHDRLGISWILNSGLGREFTFSRLELPFGGGGGGMFLQQPRRKRRSKRDGEGTTRTRAGMAKP